MNEQRVIYGMIIQEEKEKFKKIENDEFSKKLKILKAVVELTAQIENIRKIERKKLSIFQRI